MRSITPVVPRLPIAASPTPGKPRDTGASGDCEPRAASPTLLPSRRNADRAVAKGRLTPAPTCANPTSVAATTSSALQSMGWAIHRWEGHEEEGLVWLAQCQVALIRGKKRPRRASSPVPSLGRRCRQSHPRRIERPRHHSLADFSCRGRPGTDSTDTGLLKIPRPSPHLQPFAAVCAVTGPLQHGMAVQWQLKRRSHKESSRC